MAPRPPHRIERIEDVVAAHLCSGCGACAALLPDAIAMLDVADQGARPHVQAGADTGAALAACPGVGLGRPERGEGMVDDLWDEWGPVLEVWEGRATDPEIRSAAAGPGAVSALALYALEGEGFAGVLQARAAQAPPFLNETALSTTRAEVLAAAGVRYAPTSPAEGLARLTEAGGPCLFVGKACDVAGAAKAALARPELGERLGLTVALFCLGTPATRGTLELIRALGFDAPSTVDAVRYRAGDGGRTEVVAGSKASTNVPERVEGMDADRAWKRFLAPHRQWRCFLCADHTGEFADLAVGRAASGKGDRALLLVRSERGRAFLERARAAGALELEPLDLARLPGAQAKLLDARAATHGALRAARLAGLPTPAYEGFGLRAAWRARLSPWRRLRCTLWTLREILRRHLRRAAAIHVRTGRLRGIQRFGTDA